MEVKAVAKYVRISSQKVRGMSGAIKGKPVETALDLLKFMNGHVSFPWIRMNWSDGSL